MNRDIKKSRAFSKSAPTNQDLLEIKAKQRETEIIGGLIAMIPLPNRTVQFLETPHFIEPQNFYSEKQEKNRTKRRLKDFGKHKKIEIKVPEQNFGLSDFEDDLNLWQRPWHQPESRERSPT